MTTTDNSTRLEALGRERLNAVYQRDEWAARVASIDAEILALADPKKIRSWAAENGYDVAPSGIIPKAIVADYLASVGGGAA